MARVGPLNQLARAERFELPSKVLETSILPLNYARRKKSKVKIKNSKPESRLTLTFDF
jgi:hypothetical protein